MRVYAESNFVLEIALDQEEVGESRGLIEGATAKHISLVIPAISVFEPYYKIAGNGKRRRDLAQQVETQAREFGRTKGFEESSRNLRDLIRVFAESENAEQAGLSSALETVLKTCEVIPLTSDVVARALTEVRPRLGLDLPDALVYASVLEHLKTASADKSCFITKNAKDFGDPDIENELAGLGCKLLFKFGDGLGYSKSS
jgi:predicted nucleic acid-binding protein